MSATLELMHMIAECPLVEWKTRRRAEELWWRLRFHRISWLRR